MFVCCRILWITIALIRTFAFFYQCQHLGRHYLSWPVRMKIMISRQENTVFPAITICNQNAFRYCLSRLSSITNDLYASFKREHRLRKIIQMLSHVITYYQTLNIQAYAHPHAHSHAHAQADAQTREPARTRARQRTHTRTHARTHTHTHTRITFLAD